MPNIRHIRFGEYHLLLLGEGNDLSVIREKFKSSVPIFSFISVLNFLKRNVITESWQFNNPCSIFLGYFQETNNIQN